MRELSPSGRQAINNIAQRHRFSTRRERRRADEMQAEVPRLIPAHEIGDVAAGADEKDALCGDEADPGAGDHGAHQGIAHKDECGETRGVEQDAAPRE